MPGFTEKERNFYGNIIYDDHEHMKYFGKDITPGSEAWNNLENILMYVHYDFVEKYDLHSYYGSPEFDWYRIRHEDGCFCDSNDDNENEDADIEDHRKPVMEVFLQDAIKVCRNPDYPFVSCGDERNAAAIMAAKYLITKVCYPDRIKITRTE